MEENLKQLVYSQILGDGYLKNETMLVISHSEKQVDYLNVKKKLFEDLKLQVSDHTPRSQDTNFKKNYKSQSFSVKIPDLKDIDLSKGNCINRLESLGLFLWWLDDGCLSISEKRRKTYTSTSRFGWLSTEGLDLDNNDLIREVFKNKFQIATNVIQYRGSSTGSVYCRIYINAEGMRRLIDIVRKHIVDLCPQNMLYKFNMKYMSQKYLPDDCDYNDYNFN